jgi:uncharacterized protein
MVFARRTKQTKSSRQAGVAVAIVSAVTVGSSFITSVRRSGAHGGGDIGSMTTLLVFAAAVGLPVIIFLIVKAIRSGDDEGTRVEDSKTGANTGANTDSSSDSASDENEGVAPRAILLAILAAVVAIGLGMFAWVQTAHAQGTMERGALVLRNGNDTIVVDRFTRSADTLRGSSSTKGQARFDYVIALGADTSVRTMRLRAFKFGAASTEAPFQESFTTMTGDSAIINIAGNMTRLATKPGAIPDLNNALAITELFTRRARAAGGSGDYWFFALQGGQTVPLTVRPIGADSLLVNILSQKQHYKVDALGRILGGMIEGQPLTLSRANELEAAKITFDLKPAAPAEKADYSAPRGAPYSAEEVSFRGPSGITLGGTLTLPTNVRGPFPAAITITGSGQEDRDELLPIAGGIRLFRQVADTLSRVGIAVLRLDDRGLGASTGNFATSTTADFADDIRAGLAYLRSRSEIDGNRLALIGHSEGGIIGPMVAATDPKVRAMVTFGGPGDKMIEMSMAQNKWAVDHALKLTQHERDSILVFARAALQPEKQSSPMLKFWMSYDPAPAARQVKASTLILQGENDRQVPVENAEKLAALIRSGGNKDVTVRIFPGTDHLFIDDPTGDFLDMYAHLKTNKVSPVILGAMADWLKVKLGAPAVVK